jgi:hypothetical protein
MFAKWLSALLVVVPRSSQGHKQQWPGLAWRGPGTRFHRRGRCGRLGLLLCVHVPLLILLLRRSVPVPLPVAGEPLFIPRPGSTAEEDGVVVAPGIDAQGRGLMVVLDPATWTEAARVQLPFGVPNRFHGMWLPSS